MVAPDLYGSVQSALIQQDGESCPVRQSGHLTRCCSAVTSRVSSSTYFRWHMSRKTSECLTSSSRTPSSTRPSASLPDTSFLGTRGSPTRSPRGAGRAGPSPFRSRRDNSVTTVPEAGRASSRFTLAKCPISRSFARAGADGAAAGTSLKSHAIAVRTVRMVGLPTLNGIVGSPAGIPSPDAEPGLRISPQSAGGMRAREPG